MANIHTPGSFAVDPAGSATYNIPLQLPPGTAGVAPQLSFSYSSQAGVGHMGKGWALTGLSAITRCGQTVAQDGNQGGVNFDANDRYCLDGQRLVVVNGKAHGADGAEYRTERESFSRIISYGSAGSGPASFKVWTKAGQIMEYGTTADSRIEAQGKASVRVWAVNRIQDIKSNYLTVSYTEDSANGEFYPARIDYTGNTAAATAPGNSVTFTYENRSDLAPYYVAGSLVNSTKRLTKVQTYVGSAVVFDYRLAYMPDSGQLRSRLQSVVQCDGGGACLPPSTFTWQDPGAIAFSAGAWTDSDRPASSWGILDNGTILLLDINGDGKMDFVQKYMTSEDQRLWVRPAISNGNSFTFGSWLDTGTGGSLHAGDVNGDGKTDLIISDYTILRSTGNTFEIISGRKTVVPASPNDTAIIHHVLDIDGDGRADIVLQQEDDSWRAPPSKSFFAVLKSTGDAFTAGSWYQASQAPDGISTLESLVSFFPADLNGDGKMDMIEVWRRDLNNGNIWLLPFYSDGQKLNAGAWMDTGIQFYDRDSVDGRLVDQIIPMDANGDGLTDIVFSQRLSPIAQRTQLTVFPLYSTGTGFVRGTSARADQVTFPPDDFMATPDTLVPTDLNSDGRTDLVMAWRTGTDTSTWGPTKLLVQPIISTGTGFQPLAVQATGQPWGTIKGTVYDPEGGTYMLEYGPGLVYGDFNGDGKVDFMQQRFTDNVGVASFLPYYAGGQIGDLIVNIDNGIGSSVKIVHKPMTDSLVYAKDTGAAAATYPVRDLQSATYVVASSAESNGSGGFMQTTYQYGGAKRDLVRQSNLGLRWIASTDASTQIARVIENRQDWPYVGMPSRIERTLGGTKLNVVVNTYGCTDFTSGSGCPSAPGKRYFGFVSRSDETSSDLNGAAFPTISTSTVYDSWNSATSAWSDLGAIFGNPVEVTVTASDGHIRKTSNVYKNDTANWFIGRVTRTTQTNTAP